MAINRNRICSLRLVILLFAFSAGDLAMAQSAKLVQDKDVGVRLSIPSNWEYRSRDRDIFIDCAPGKDDRGRPACYITVGKRKAPLDQKAVTDADRARWKGWSSTDSSSPIISTRDFKVAGFPAYEVVKRSLRYALRRRVAHLPVCRVANRCCRSRSPRDYFRGVSVSIAVANAGLYRS